MYIGVSWVAFTINGSIGLLHKNFMSGEAQICINTKHLTLTGIHVHACTHLDLTDLVGAKQDRTHEEMTNLDRNLC